MCVTAFAVIIVQLSFFAQSCFTLKVPRTTAIDSALISDDCYESRKRTGTYIPQDSWNPYPCL